MQDVNEDKHKIEELNRPELKERCVIYIDQKTQYCKFVDFPGLIRSSDFLKTISNIFFMELEDIHIEHQRAIIVKVIF